MTYKKKKSLFLFSQGVIVGILTAGAALYGINYAGDARADSGSGITAVLNWCALNLGASLIVFAMVLAGYVYYLYKLCNTLKETSPDSSLVRSLEEKTELLTSLFFAVGVIWTAIGMRNALLVSLGNMDAELAASKGAFVILKKLVDGGILVALSTTIFGGVGGYFMRAARSWFAGKALNDFYETEHLADQKAVTDRLDKIVDLIGEKGN